MKQPISRNTLTSAVKWFALVIIIASRVSAQQPGIVMPAPNRTAAPPQRTPPEPLRPEDAVTIEGSVTNSVTGEPVKNAHVTLQGFSTNGITGMSAVLTDASGRFTAKNLRPGQYTLVANKQGFVSALAGQPSGRPPAPTSAAPGQRLTGLNLKLTPQSVITGRVVDLDGEPLVYAQVSAMKFDYTPDGRKLSTQATAQTNDVGEYRLFALNPGKYYISATAQYRGAIDFLLANAPTETYVQTYYPAVTDPGSALQLELTPGSVMQSIDIRMGKTNAYQVSGKVMNAPNPNGVMVNLTPTGRASMQPWTTQMLRDGSFVMRNVSPGEYTLQVMVRDGQSTHSGRQTVIVASANVENISLYLAPPFDVKGTARIEGAAQGRPPTDLRNMPILLRPATASGALQGSFARINPDGTFILTGIPANTYRIGAIGQQGLVIKSAKLGEQDMLETNVDITNGSAELQVVFSANPGQLSVNVTNTDGTPIQGAIAVMIPDSAQRRKLPDFYRAGQTNAEGKYNFPAPLFGRYKIYAFEKIDTNAWLDDDIMRQYDGKGITADIQESSRQTLDLKALPPPR
jgi:5-hydroxyisourate hydrolase-like protein (transthyretin family)